MCRTGHRGRIGASVAATLMLASGQLFAQEAAAAAVKFNIESQPLARALNTWADQAGLQIIWPVGDPIAYESSPPVRGRLEPMEALRVLLGDTGLTFSLISGGRTVAIHRRDPTPGLRTAAIEAVVGPQRTADSANEPGSPLAVRQPVKSTAPSSSRAPQDEPGVDELEEIVVTGTHIRGAQGGAGSKVVVIDREFIDASGYATVQDVLKVLPQNFNGGVGEDTGAADASALNLNRGSSINLRGLGADSTLVLVNGRRQASGGLSGSFIDVSSIAASAIDRVEILTDGASSIYGSDAVAGVVNILLRKDFTGAETGVRYGEYHAGASESQVSQLFGGRWTDGHALIGYQYLNREALAKADFAYTASADLRPFGGTDLRPIESIYNSPGNIVDDSVFPPAPAYAIPPGDSGGPLLPTDLIPGANYREPSSGADLLPEQVTHSGFFDLSHRLGPDLEFFIEGRVANRSMEHRLGGERALLLVPATHPFFVDPFGGRDSITVAYSFLEALGPITLASDTDTSATAAGFALNFGSSWRVITTASYAREKTALQATNQLDFGALDAALNDPDATTAFNPFGPGGSNDPQTLAAIRRTDRNEARTHLLGINAIADGPVFSLPGGVARLAFGADYREENLRASSEMIGAADSAFVTDSDRQVTAAFAELKLPIVTDTNARGGLQRLEFNVSARAEEYSDFGTTTNPKVGALWKPLEWMSIRGTWGKSFKAPRLTDLDDSPSSASANGGSFAFILPIEDPQSESGFSNALLRLGGNRDLEPETATIWTVGVDFEPFEHFDIGLTYSDIDYQDRIAVGGPAGDILAILVQENLWAPLITRNPTQEQVDAICQSAAYQDFGLGSCSELPTIVDLRVRNLASVRVKSLDLSFQHTLETALGRFGYGLSSTYFVDFERQVTAAAPSADVTDTFGNPTRMRVRANSSFSRGSFGIDAFVNHTGGYDDDFNPPNGKIDSWTTADLALSYRAASAGGLFDGVIASFNLVNVFDEDPPFVNTLGGYDTANADLYGRIWSLQLRKMW